MEGAGQMTVVPLTVRAIRAHVRAWHRHLPEVQGGLFGAGLESGGGVVAVALAGNPARVWQGTGRIVISRVAVGEAAPNACSKLYGALCRAAEALGYREAWTYTLPHEPGTSLRAAGFEDMGLTSGGEHDRPSRRRAPAKHPEQKRRWRRVLRPR